MRAVVTREGGGLVLTDLARPVVPPGGGRVRVALCGLCGSDLEKLAAASSVPGVVLGHEVVGWLDRAGAEPVRVALAHHVPCGGCALCLSGHSSLCARFKQTDLDPGGFSEELAVSSAHLSDAVFPVPPEVDDFSATLLEPLSCVLRAVETAAGLMKAFPPPQVAAVVSGGAGGRAVAAERPGVLVAGCGSVGLLFLSVLAAARARADESPVGSAAGPAGAVGAEGGPDAAGASGAFGPPTVDERRAFDPGLLWFMEPDEGRAALARGLGARDWAHGGREAEPPRLAFVTAPAALPTVVELLAPGGVVVVFAGGPSSARVDFDLVYRRELTLTGVRSGSPRHLRQALAALASGDLPLGWYRPEVVDLAGLPAAAMRYARGEVLKVVVRV